MGEASGFSLSALLSLLTVNVVGASRFERPTSRTPSECATGLRYAPTHILLFQQVISQLI